MPDIAWVDTVDVCHLKCPTCLRGARVMDNSSRAMTVEMFSAIAARLRQDGYLRVGFFSWTEPFLNRRIHEFVAIAKAAGLHVWISSTLSLRRIANLEDALAAGIDLLTVSTSGADQATYEINHIGGNLTYVFKSLELVREIITRRALSTRVDLRFLRFDYNAHQVPEMRAYAERMDFNFEEVTGNGDPKANMYADVDSDSYSRAVRDSAALPWPSPEENGKVCGLMFDQTAIDCLGDVYLCCIAPTQPAFRIGNYLEMTADEILSKKFVNPYCRGCTMPRRDPSVDEGARLQRMQALIAQARDAQQLVTSPVLGSKKQNSILDLAALDG